MIFFDYFFFLPNLKKASTTKTKIINPATRKLELAQVSDNRPRDLPASCAPSVMMEEVSGNVVSDVEDDPMMTEEGEELGPTMAIGLHGGVSYELAPGITVDLVAAGMFGGERTDGSYTSYSGKRQTRYDSDLIARIAAEFGVKVEF